MSYVNCGDDGKWSDDRASGLTIVRVELSRCPVVQGVRHRGEHVCCSVVFGTWLVCLCLVLCGPSC